MTQFYAVTSLEFNSARSACDCLAHRFGNAADQPDRVPVYGSDMTDAQWAVVRDALPTPGWMEGRGGRPEGYCHRQMTDAVFYVTDNGTKWRTLGWLMRSRRLVRDLETPYASSEAFIYWSQTMPMSRRLARTSPARRTARPVSPPPSHLEPTTLTA